MFVILIMSGIISTPDQEIKKNMCCVSKDWEETQSW